MRRPGAAALRAVLALAAASTPGCPSAGPPDDLTPAPVPVAALAPAPIRALVGEVVALSAAGSVGAATYRWDFGDGARTEPSSLPDTTHTWSAPGHYLVGLEVRGPDGRPAQATARATVSWPLAAARPTASSALDLDASGLRALALSPDFDGVAVVDLAARAATGWYATCARPAALSHSTSPEAPDVLVVACPDDDAVEAWDTARHERLGRLTLPWGSRPVGVAAPSTGTSAFVALAGTGDLAEVDVTPTGPPSLVRTIPILDDPRAVAALGPTVVVARHRSDPAEGRWALVDATTGTVEVHALARDPGPDSDTTSRGVPSLLGAALAPDGRAAWFPSLQSNVERGLFLDGQPLTHETASRAVLSSAALTQEEADRIGAAGPGAERTRKVFDDRDLASAVAFSPAGDLVYVGTLGMETVEVLDAYTAQAQGSVLGLTGGVDGLAVARDGAEIYAVSLAARTLTVLTPEPAGLGAVAVVPLAPEGGADPLEPEALRGRLVFQRAADPRMTKDGYLSCATCHPGGGSDRLVWDFTDRGEGLRSTIPLHGRGGTLHGPIHWSANFDEIQDFENDVRGPMQGAGFLSDADWEEAGATLGPPKAGRSADLDALAAYVATLTRFPRSPHRAPDGALTPEAELGEALFVQPARGCVDCHPPPAYTDSAWLAPGQPLLHDVGTLQEGSGQRLGGPLLGLDTPTLRGLFDSPPYLHDGSAESVRDVLTRSAADGDAHGVTSDLTETELDALAAFLLSIE